MRGADSSGTRYLWGVLALLLAGVLLYGWNRMLSPEPQFIAVAPVGPIEARDADVISAVEQRLASLERRLAALETKRISASVESSPPPTKYTELQDRLEAVEMQLRRQPGDETFSGVRPDHERKMGLYKPEDIRSEADKIQRAFEQDASVEPAQQTALENAATIFERQELATLEFNALQCREKYCKLSYVDNSTSVGASTIAENELFMLLAKEYGSDIVIHGGGQEGTTRSFYIERDVSR